MRESDVYFLLIMCLVSVSSGITLDPVKTALSVENPISGQSDANINSALNNINRNEDIRNGETRFNDPSPEYYKGPNGYNRDRFNIYDAINQKHRPLFPTGYENPYINKHFGLPSHRDKVSVLGTGSYNNNNYANDRSRPYGPPQAVDVPVGYNSGGGDWNSGHGLDWGHGYGNEHGSIWEEKFGYLSKSHLVPIAGIALLGIAAALIANPVLLQLGTMAGKRRRRRDTSASSSYKHRIFPQELAYNAYRKPIKAN